MWVWYVHLSESELERAKLYEPALSLCALIQLAFQWRRRRRRKKRLIISKLNYKYI